ncbi:MAG: amidophosphoribosyltransferase [Victivallaceae bacterium]|nr:amidophosphoribosyltransferase [Victivallaceae bacterium]
MGGFFGVTGHGDCVSDLFYGTDYHSHLGTRRGGMAVYDGDGRITRSIHDITNAQFRSKFDDDLASFSGCSGIGIISDFEDQPLLISSQLGRFAIATVGKINNIEELTGRLLRNRFAHFAETGNDSEPNPTELVAALISEHGKFADGIRHAQNVIDGSCSILILHENTIYAARDLYGRTPVIIGEKPGEGFAVTMETTAFPNLGYNLKHELGPGEIVEITADKLVQKREPLSEMQICAFLWVYYGYPSSCYEGINTETVRYANGSLIAEDDDVEVDSICGIPDSGIAHAIGYSNYCKVPYQRSFVKYTPTWPRSFMPQNQSVRNLVAKMKLIPVEQQIRGKRLLFCDDSIVRGTQLKDTVVRLYDAGAKEVHMRSSCPPLVFGCKFLNFSRSRSEMDLAARRAIEKLEGGAPSDEALAKYLSFGSPEYLEMVEEIRRDLNLSSLKFQSLDNLVKAIGLPKEKLCTYCWDGYEPESAKRKK